MALVSLAGVLRVERHEQEAVAAGGLELVEHTADRGLAVAHRVIDDEVSVAGLPEQALDEFGLAFGVKTFSGEPSGVHTVAYFRPTSSGGC